MGKEQKGVFLIGATSSAIAFLILLTWVYASESWSVWTVDYSNNGEEIDYEPLISRLLSDEDRLHLNSTGFSCQDEACIASKQIKIQNGELGELTVYIPSAESRFEKTIKPYTDQIALDKVSSIRIVFGETNSPDCNINHSIPVIVFSSGGFSKNLYHSFDDIIIPLFITTRHFKSRVKFFITDYKRRWVKKYSRILKHLTNYEIIHPGKYGNDNSIVHCFPGGVLGLKFHGYLAINSSDFPQGYTMYDFRRFLRESYHMRINNVTELESEKPRLMLISRQYSRVITNEDEMVMMMEELGFEVVRSTPNTTSNLERFALEVNSCRIMIAAHGAGMTNELFLPDGAVVVQLVPLGLDWASSHLFGQPTKQMGLHYLEYKIEPEESSLLEKYGRDHKYVTDPDKAISGATDYSAFRAVYVDGQNLKVNVLRFRKTLLQAMELISLSN